jgi:hypothetical protein
LKREKTEDGLLFAAARLREDAIPLRLSVHSSTAEDLETLSTSTLLGKTRTLGAHMQRHTARQTWRSINTNRFLNVAIYWLGTLYLGACGSIPFLAQKLDPAKRGYSLAAVTQSLALASSTFPPRLRK